MADSPHSFPALVALEKYDEVGPTRIVTIPSRTFTLGRTHDSSLKILEKAISRKHCTLEKRDDGRWTATSHSRNAVTVNNKQLRAEEAYVLQCGDEINLVNVRKFQFKCSLDQDGKCYCVSNGITRDIRNLSTRTQLRNSTTPVSPELVDLSSPSPININEPSTSSSNVVSSFEPIVPNEMSIPKDVREIEETILKYIQDLTPEKTLADQLNKNVDLLKELQNMINLHRSEDTEKFNVSLPTFKRLFSIIKTNYPSVNCLKRLEISDERLKTILTKLDSLLAEYVNSFMSIVPSMLDKKDHKDKTEDVFLSGEDTLPEKSYKDVGASSPSLEEQKLDESVIVVETNLRDELKDYKQNAEWQEARIKYLEMKLKERDKMERELETTKESVEDLRSEIVKLKRVISEKELMETELQYLKEIMKYKDADKRSKDELEKQIDILKRNESALKSENEKFASIWTTLESEVSSLKQKCGELEAKISERNNQSLSGIFPRNSISTSCCDIRDKLLEFLEKEFTCCICGDMYIEPTITNCNHIFCSYCLKEWKKKKKQCPFCRSNLLKECKANVIDECISSLMKMISDAKYAERLQMIEERKHVEGPVTKRSRRSTIRVAPVNTLMNPMYAAHMQYNVAGPLMQHPLAPGDPYQYQANYYAPVIDLINHN